MKRELKKSVLGFHVPYWFWFISLQILLSGTYILFSKIGFRLAFLNSQVSPVWPPEGMGLTSLLLAGNSALPGLFLGAFLANLLNNPHLPTALIIGFGNTLSSFINFSILKRLSGGIDPLYSTRTLIIFTALSSIVGSLVSAGLGVTSLLYFGFLPKEVYWNVFFTWFSGEMQGFLIVAPLLYVWLQRERSLSLKLWRKLEFIILIGLVYISGKIAFSDVLPLLFLPIPFLILMALRFREWGATLAAAVLSFTAVLQTIEGTGVFAMKNLSGGVSINDTLIYLDGFLFSINGIAYLLVVVTRERERAQREAVHSLEAINQMKEAANEDLERKVEERTLIIQKQATEIEKQLDVAKRIQESLFPSSLPKLPELEVAFQNEPMMKVGGDLLAIHLTENRRTLGVFICDVSGHGIPAAFLSALVKMSLSYWNKHLAELNQSFKELRNQIKENLKGHFVTASAVTVDLDRKILTFVRAGHFPLYIIKEDGRLITLSPAGKIIAELFEPKTEELEYSYEKNDIVVLPTDGLTEARPPKGGDFFGEEKLLDLLISLRHEPLEQMKRKVFDSVVQYSGGKELLADDLTLVLLKFN